MNPHIHDWSRLGDKELVELVEQGIKPICETHEKVKTSLKYIRVPQKAKMEGQVVRWSMYVYYPQGHKLDAERAAKLLRKANWSDEDDIEFGLLMGYDLPTIKAWVEYNRKEDDERQK